METQVHHLVYSNPATTAETTERVFGFLQQQLRQGTNYAISSEYPSLYREFPGGESLWVEVGGTIASHVAFVVREFQHPQYRMKIGMIGSVTTSPAFRGKGLATMLVSTAVAHLRRKGCTLVVLWSPDEAFYQPLGFSRYGRETQLVFSKDSVTPSDRQAIPFNPKTDMGGIWRLYQQHDVRLDRSLEELRCHTSIPKVEIYVTKKNDQITSYLAIHKGADFTNFIHEWAGDLQELQWNIAAVQTQKYPDQSLTLIAPGHYDVSLLRAMATEKRDGVLGLVKLLDRNGLIYLYTKHLSALGQNTRWDKETSVLHTQAERVSLKEDAETLEVILGGRRQNLPPLPLFVWGLDSI
jgi:predicted N-acetyltransferase YhbS